LVKNFYPTGEEPINPLGIDHYNEVIDTLISAGIQPFVTLYHWDLPSDLETNYGGWTNASISDFYTLYAQTVFAAFGDRVKFWLTFNEPLSFCWLGYGAGIHAPGRCTERSICPYGDSATEPYLCAHNVLISHAETVQIYREQFQPTQKGHIGITLNCDWAEPLTNSTADQLAAERNLLFQLGWYADPVWFGDYPAVMKQFVGNRLPEFTPDQQKLLKGSYDFFALNHYTTSYASNCSNPPANLTLGWQTDQRVNLTKTSVNGTLIGPPADSSWLYVVPWGFRKILNWIWQRYNTPIYVTENGVDVPNESSLPILVALNDTFRVNFYQSYLSNLLAAITEDGVDVRGYMAWSLLDNFEWADGYSKRFGVHYVDYENNLTRYTKLSSNYLRGVINGTINVNLPYSTYFNNVS